MSDRPRPSEGETRPEDDIEILEVVGLGDDAAPGLDEDAADVELVFDEVAEAPPPPAEAVETVPRERFLRMQADFDNYRKRVERERADNVRFATAEVVARLLPVLDNLDWAIAAARRSGGEDGLRAGVELIHRQMLEELGRVGLSPMGTVGQPFDPERHEAVATDESTGLPPNTVVKELRRGYLLNDRVIRPALVTVTVDDPGSGSDDGPPKES